ncbi:hypothetical protein WJX72_001371 [[Myrmecia] bisecta]|uniref:CCT domain-containing protein n=1 Tax=[Myrmecia] bisecta TaxID=41462 RepID=A0AAW1R4L2_9CHLO
MSLAELPLPASFSPLCCPNEDHGASPFAHLAGFGFGDMLSLEGEQFPFGWGLLDDQALEFSGSGSDASSLLSDALVPNLDECNDAEPTSCAQIVPAAPFHKMPRLQLDYGNVLSAWAEMGGQVADADEAELSASQCSQQPLCSSNSSLCLSAAGTGLAGAGKSEEELRDRAACLERYREKKRNRAFSKTIRYEMRKINAERRPRIKGRFVKRSDLEDYLDDKLALSPFRANSVDSCDSCFGL